MNNIIFAAVTVSLTHGVFHILAFIYIRHLKAENERLANNLWDIALANAKWAAIYGVQGFPETGEAAEDDVRLESEARK